MNARIKWTPAMDNLLGTVSDAKAAKELGLCIDTIQRRRLKIGAPACGQSCRMDNYPGVRSKLGMAPDTEIARMLGVAKSTVAAYRRCRGIPAFKGKSPGPNKSAVEFFG